MLSMHGISIDATDIFGRKGFREIEESFPKLKGNERIVMEGHAEKTIRPV